MRLIKLTDMKDQDIYINADSVSLVGHSVSYGYDREYLPYEDVRGVTDPVPCTRVCVGGEEIDVKESVEGVVELLRFNQG